MLVIPRLDFPNQFFQCHGIKYHKANFFSLKDCQEERRLTSLPSSSFLLESVPFLLRIALVDAPYEDFPSDRFSPLQSAAASRKGILCCSRASDRFPWLRSESPPRSCHHPVIPLPVCPYGYSFSAILSGPSSAFQFADLAHEFLGRLECRNVVCRNDDGCVL